jgi:hypothetical protein
MLEEDLATHAVLEKEARNGRISRADVHERPETVKGHVVRYCGHGCSSG